MLGTTTQQMDTAPHCSPFSPHAAAALTRYLGCGRVYQPSMRSAQVVSRAWYGATEMISVKVLRTMIEHGADMTRRTASHVAVSEDQFGAIDVLAGAGTNGNARAALGETPLHYATKMLSLGFVCHL